MQLSEVFGPCPHVSVDEAKGRSTFEISDQVQRKKEVTQQKPAENFRVGILDNISNTLQNPPQSIYQDVAYDNRPLQRYAEVSERSAAVIPIESSTESRRKSTDGVP